MAFYDKIGLLKRDEGEKPFWYIKNICFYYSKLDVFVSDQIRTWQNADR